MWASTKDCVMSSDARTVPSIPVTHDVVKTWWLFHQFVTMFIKFQLSFIFFFGFNRNLLELRNVRARWDLTIRLIKQPWESRRALEKIVQGNRARASSPDPKLLLPRYPTTPRTKWAIPCLADNPKHTELSNQRFSNCNVHTNHLGILLKDRLMLQRSEREPPILHF